jgi:hypothetical protein
MNGARRENTKIATASEIFSTSDDTVSLGNLVSRFQNLGIHNLFIGISCLVIPLELFPGLFAEFTRQVGQKVSPLDCELIVHIVNL